MDLFCLGLSHHTAAVSVRERFAVADAEVARFLAALRREAGLREAALLSTCNRVEVYGVADDAFQPANACGLVLARHAGMEADLYRLADGAAVRHLFRVAAGLDSMVVGETEILGQVKASYGAAVAGGHAGPVLHRVFQQALRAAKQVHSTTGVSRGAVSVGSAAVALAGQALGDLGACRALVLGSGEAGGIVARNLRSRGIGGLFVSNRDASRAAALAEECGGEAVAFADWQSLLETVEIIVASAAAPRRLLRAADLAPVMATRSARPLFMLDLAVPRDFEPGIARIPGVCLHDIDALEALAREGRELRARETARAEDLIASRANALAAGMSAPFAAAA
jgi:glutamyl-tRNA reductase